MKTKLTLLIFLFSSLLYLGSSAQSYYYLTSTGGDAAYDFTYSGTFVVQGTNPGLKDTLTAAQTIPFNFKFFGTDYTKYKISDNGYITFDLTQTTSVSANESLPSATAPKNAIFAFWDALSLTKPDATYRYAILNWTYGTAPNRVHVIQWFQIRSEPSATTTSIHTFAIRLFESGTKNFDIVHNLYYKGTGTEATTTGTVGCQNADATLGAMVTGSPNLSFPKTVISTTNVDDINYEFYFGTQATYDLKGNSLTVLPFAKVGSSVPITGTLRNQGTATITSLKLNYTIDGGATVSQTINSLSIKPSDVYSFTHPTNWVAPTTEKNYTLEVWASELNGNADENLTNDKVSMTISVVANFAERISLHEVFTSSTCPPCRPGNVQLDGILAYYPGKWTCVKYQYNFPGTGDPYYTTECASRGSFYGGINSVPSLKVDGGLGWNGNPGAYSTFLFEEAKAKPSFVNISANAVFNGQSVTVTGNVTSYADLSGTIKLYMAVVEKKTTKNIKTNGETEFYYVMKKMIPNASGVTVSPVSKNTPIPINQNFTFPGDYKLAPNGQSPINLLSEHSVEEFSDLAVVVWLQNTSTREVYQSAFAGTGNSIDEPANNFKVSLYPNPVNTTGQIRFSLETPAMVSFDIINSLGQKVYSNVPANMSAGIQTLDFDASTLSNGVYFMKLNVGGQSVSRTFLK